VELILIILILAVVVVAFVALGGWASDLMKKRAGR
jgi:hypothetical protein